MSRSGDTRGAEFSPVYLGYVQHIIAGAHADVGKLQPVVEVPMDERTPPRVLDGDDVIERFLYSGRVSWYHFPEGVELNSWWSFRIEEAETFDATNQRH